ncbi:MAG TPA: CBS and ACT domain-containing protein [Spirochaetia bacterium]|nr:CBS and ACT domain-containing protein [Spirochaetia bacterium]
MLVRERMTRNPIFIRPDTPVTEAQALMKREKIHHLPVLDKDEKLVGIVAEKDLLYASPSVATTLSVFEMTSLLARLKVEKVMSRDVVSVGEDVPLEEAARIMADRGIGGLPIVRGKAVVGIITESDLFRIFIELFGARQKGTRATVTMSNEKGTLAKITAAISAAGGNIIALGTYLGEDPSTGRCTVKVGGVSRDTVVAALTPLVRSVDDVRDV